MREYENDSSMKHFFLSVALLLCVAASVRQTYQYHLPPRSTACEAQARSPWKAHGNVAVDTGVPR